MTPERTRRLLLAALREKIIPWAEEGGIERFVLARPPMRAPRGVGLSYHAGSPLQETPTEYAHDYICQWPGLHLHSMRSPRLCCVLEGEIDWRIGITKQSARKMGGAAARSDYHVLALKTGTFFLMPPGIPFSDGEQAHWERPEKQESATVFLMQILPFGVFCHSCRSDSEGHFGNPTTYTPDSLPREYARQLTDELLARTPGYKSRARSALLGILRRIEFSLSNDRLPQFQVGAALLHTEAVEAVLPPNASDAVRAACVFIHASLHQPLNLESIALHSGLSAPQLNRRFRAELKASVMQFARERRLHVAKALLCESSLPVQNIGEMVGYPNQSHFARIFAHCEKISPLAYRKRHSHY